MDTINELFEEQIKDLYSAETQLLKALPKMAEKATDGQLKASFEKHLRETEEQVDRLTKIAMSFGFKTKGKKCKAMEGLIEESKEVLDEDGDPSIIDLALISAAQRVEHYEISAYTSALLLAEKLGSKDVMLLLQATLAEEMVADKLLSVIGRDTVIKTAPLEQELDGLEEDDIDYEIDDDLDAEELSEDDEEATI